MRGECPLEQLYPTLALVLPLSLLLALVQLEAEGHQNHRVLA